MEAIRVTAVFDEGGGITPTRFEKQGYVYQIDSVGRSCEDEEGTHILVMAGGTQVYHLLFAVKERCWYLIPRLQAQTGVMG